MSKNAKAITSSTQLKRTENKTSYYVKTKDLIERAKEELEKERERKRLRTLYKPTKTKESTSSTICSMSTNVSDVSYTSTNSFQEYQQWFTNDIVDRSKTPRENLYLIKKQLREILNKNNKKKGNIHNGYKKHMNIQI